MDMEVREPCDQMFSLKLCDACREDVVWETNRGSRKSGLII